MSMPSINDLSPLEEAVVSKSDNIAGKWRKGNGYVPTLGKGQIADPMGIVGKWAGGSGYVKPDPEDERNKISSSISDKFKKPQ
jgi:hypothetical protein